MKSSYIPADRFIQICASPFGELHALDENGIVWKFNREHQVWIPLPRNQVRKYECAVANCPYEQQDGSIFCTEHSLPL